MAALLKTIISSSAEGTKAGNIGVLVLRVFVGLAMAFAHGMGKFPIPDQLIEGISAMGFPMPTAFAHAAAFSEAVGGLLLALGLFTRPAAAFVAFTMLVAGFVVHAADPFHIKELAFLYLAIGVFFLLHGAGRYSLDFVLQKKLK
ncbi:putative oxidoreductase CatD [compost metagenome]